MGCCIGSPFQLEASLTVGVVSAKGRQKLRITDLEVFIPNRCSDQPRQLRWPFT